MRTTEEKIKVMQAFLNGEKIQVYDKHNEKWVDAYTPSWNWESRDYRIKAADEYEPFETASEFLESHQIHENGRVKDRFGMLLTPFVNANDDVMLINNCTGSYHAVHFGTLFSEYVWESDGTPCGKLKE